MAKTPRCKYVVLSSSPNGQFGGPRIYPNGAECERKRGSLHSQDVMNQAQAEQRHGVKTDPNECPYAAEGSYAQCDWFKE